MLKETELSITKISSLTGLSEEEIKEIEKQFKLIS